MSTGSRFNHKKFLAGVKQRPGVYQMLDESGKVLYVGKAKNLRNRIVSYFRSRSLGTKTAALMKKMVDMQVTVTGSETEALLLEQNLIKSLKPPYNILLRDDKSYPYIFLTATDAFPALGKHRGAKKRGVAYFGPYPNALAVRETLNLLQKSFRVRQCDESYFRNRTRPCLQYQINRCTAPCVGLISPQDYAEDVRHTRMFLEGKSRQIIEELQREMDRAAADLAFERAASIRDQLIHLRRIQEQQHVTGTAGEMDLVVGLIKPVGFCVQVLFVRGGRVLGSRTYYPKVDMLGSVEELLSGFIPQFYLAANTPHQIPREIVTNAALEAQDVIAEALRAAAGYRVKIVQKVRSERAHWLKLALDSAEQNLLGRHAGKMDYHARLRALQEALGLDALPRRMECFDISHSAGEATKASCVVFDDKGPMKSDYRRFNIEGITGGDDYAAMRQAIERRYQRLQKEEAKLPEILFIDGGKGQLRLADDVLAALGIKGVMLVAVAKGASRKAGLESLFVAGRGDEIALSPNSPALLLIQHIRDEAHRFAISGHRQARGKKRSRSPLEGIPGVGPKRRRELLRFFGGLQEITRAGVDEIARVPGISRALADAIYASLHDG